MGEASKIHYPKSASGAEDSKGVCVHGHIGSRHQQQQKQRHVMDAHSLRSCSYCMACLQSPQRWHETKSFQCLHKEWR